MSFPPALPIWDVYAGDDQTLSLAITHDGHSADLGAWTGWRATFRPTLPGATTIDENAQPVPLGVDESGKSGGLIVITIPASLCAVGGQIRDGVWDVQASNAGRVKTWARGQIRWMGDVTR